MNFGNQELWILIVDISASMLGFILVVIGLVITAQNENRLEPSNARALMYCGIGSMITFLLSLIIGLLDLINPTLSDNWRQMGIYFFSMGFLIIVFVITIIIFLWLKESIKYQPFSTNDDKK